MEHCPARGPHPALHPPLGTPEIVVPWRRRLGSVGGTRGSRVAVIWSGGVHLSTISGAARAHVSIVLAVTVALACLQLSSLSQIRDRGAVAASSLRVSLSVDRGAGVFTHHDVRGGHHGQCGRRLRLQQLRPSRHRLAGARVPQPLSAGISRDAADCWCRRCISTRRRLLPRVAKSRSSGASSIRRWASCATCSTISALSTHTRRANVTPAT